MTLSYTVRPISDRTWMRPPGARRRSQFTASWSDTLDMLERELDHLDARRLVLEMDVTERDIRIDGQVRANARPSSDAVVAAFESKHGPLQYRSDAFNAVAWGARNQAPWQANVRAIALTLEALRAVDRYGATARGEQYRGFKAIGAGTGVEPTGMTTELAYTVIERESGYLGGYVREQLDAAVRKARAAAHPDRHHGDRSRYDAVDQAVQVLERAGRL